VICLQCGACYTRTFDPGFCSFECGDSFWLQHDAGGPVNLPRIVREHARIRARYEAAQHATWVAVLRWRAEQDRYHAERIAGIRELGRKLGREKEYQRKAEREAERLGYEPFKPFRFD
jgi:hypothetical protein